MEKRKRKSGSIKEGRDTPGKQRKVAFDAVQSGVGAHDENVSTVLSVPGYRCRSFAEARRRFPVLHDDLGEDEQLWLLQLPADIDINQFAEQTLDTEEPVKVGKRRFELRVASVPEEGQRDLVLLPSEKRAKLKLSLPLSGTLQLRETVKLPRVSRPKVPDTTINQPEGLDHIFQPFGYSETTTASTQGATKKKKKADKKHKKSKK